MTIFTTIRPNCRKRGYGSAITSLDEREDGTIWVGNGEYGSQVAFCPYCGYEAKIKPEVQSEG